MRPRCLIVIPTYNEAQNILSLSRAVLEQDDTLEVLVIDDASPDGCGDLVARAGEDEPRLHLLRRDGKLGLGSAYLAGFSWALERGYDLVVTMDGDWSHHPRHLPQFLRATSEYDLIIGSRYVADGGIVRWGLHRRLLSRFANFYTRALMGLRVRDCTSGYRCYSREVLEATDPFASEATGYSFLEEMVWRVDRMGFRIGEIPIIFESRQAGESKIDRAEIWKAAWHVLRTALMPTRARSAPTSVERRQRCCLQRRKDPACPR